MNPLLRSIIRDQGKWDLDKLEDQIREVLSEDEEECTYLRMRDNISL